MKTININQAQTIAGLIEKFADWAVPGVTFQPKLHKNSHFYGWIEMKVAVNRQVRRTYFISPSGEYYTIFNRIQGLNEIFTHAEIINAD